MSDKNNNIKDKIKQDMFSGSQELPEALQPQNITKLVRNKEQKKSTRGRTVAKRIVACAAAIAVVVTAGSIGFKQLKPEIKPVKATEGKTEASVYTSDYASIQNFFISLKDVYKFDGFTSRFRMGNYKYAFVDEEIAYESAAAGDVAVANSADSSASGSYSKTELQVDGVDEADTVKTDGRYLYVSSMHGNNSNTVTVIDPSNPADMKAVARIRPEAKTGGDVSICEFFLCDGKMIVVARESTRSYITAEGKDVYNDAVCCYVGSFGNQTNVYIYSLENIANPTLIKSYGVDGYYVSSRISDGRLTLVTNYSVPLYTDNDKLKEVCIPSYTDGDEKIRFAEDSISIIKDNEEDTYTLVMLVPLGEGSPETSAVLGGGSEIYCNRTDLYVSSTEWDDNTDDYYTEIFRFDLTDGGKFKGEVKIKGNILNQFSMDEFGGYFRIATTTDGANTITVLDKALNTVGQLTGIAPGEDIYAVRFIGSTAYVVTFLQTDPLFVIDLSDPANPKIAGELKLPGFSNMLYPLDNNYLIGIGRDGDENGSNGDMKISLFDISNPANPQEVSKAIIKDGGYSPAEYEHKAFLRLADPNEFVIPVYRGAESFLCSFKVENGKLSQYKTYSDGNDSVYRGAYIGNTLFAIDYIGVSAFDLASTERLSRLTVNNEDKDYINYDTGDDIVLY